MLLFHGCHVSVIIPWSAASFNLGAYANLPKMQQSTAGAVAVEEPRGKNSSPNGLFDSVSMQGLWCTPCWLLSRPSVSEDSVKYFGHVDSHYHRVGRGTRVRSNGKLEITINLLKSTQWFLRS
jgi:hypothetical protein